MAEWTGGIANREYRRGTRVAPTLTEGLRDYLDRQVESYLADVSRFRLTPSEERCLSVVYTQDAKQEEYVAETYLHLLKTVTRG